MRSLALTVAIALPTAALAVGSEDSTPPTPTHTTKTCESGMVWDAATAAWVAPKESRLDDETLYRAAREFAYHGRMEHALSALDAMSDQQGNRVLTYRGFAHRKLGDMAAGIVFHARALERNPDNLMARSYRGQAYVEQGKLALARAELSQIRSRGGRGTWPEVALRLALESGRGTSY